MRIQAFGTSPISENQVDKDAFVSQEHSLRVSLAQCNKRTAAKQIFFAWPNLEEASKKLARMLSHEYPSVYAQPLLEHALSEACQAYEKTAAVTNHEEAPMAAYLQALIEFGSEAINFNVHGVLPDGKTIEWRVFERPLIDWVKKNMAVRLVFNKARAAAKPAEIRSARTLLSSHIASFDDLVFIERFGK